ncbi:MAG TPA: glutaminase A [Ignavibacteria bacterium]|nr:glutaminase A [Ignavibacteria bacterium]
MKNNIERKVRLVLASLLCLIFISGNVSAQKNQLTKEDITAAVNEAYNKYKDVKEGANADYIPALAEVDPNIFGIAVVTVDGTIVEVGDIAAMVSMQSIEKVFAMAMVIEDLGSDALKEKVGVDATGMKFNAIEPIEWKKGKEMNPCVNPGALATTSLIKGSTAEDKWTNIINTYSDFAGRTLTVNQPVYESEAATNQRNQALSWLLFAYERMYFDPVKTTDIYTKACAINVNAKDLGIMAATLGNAGVNPITNKVVVSPNTTEHTLPVMVTAGLYDDSGIWIYDTGMPGKSGVGGGIIAVAPGKLGIGVISPPLDEAGNSVKAQYVIKYLSEKLGLNMYNVQPSK